MAHIRIEDFGHKYRLYLSDEDGSWVCSEGPLRQVFVDMLNQQAPIADFNGPVHPMPQNRAIRSAVVRLEELSVTILTVVYDTPDPREYDPDKKQVVY